MAKRKETMRQDASECGHDLAEQNEERRKRLAQNIGRLLARRWLQQHLQQSEATPPGTAEKCQGTNRTTDQSEIVTPTEGRH